MKVKLLDIWKLDNEYRLITRSSADFNLFCMVSLGTGESTPAMNGKRLHEYLSGKNELNAEFVYHSSLTEILEDNIEDYYQCASIIVSDS